MSTGDSGAAAVKQQHAPGRLTAGLLGAAAALSLAFAQPALAAEPFLKSTGEPRALEKMRCHVEYGLLDVGGRL